MHELFSMACATFSLCHGAAGNGCMVRYFRMNITGPRYPPIHGTATFTSFVVA